MLRDYLQKISRKKIFVSILILIIIVTAVSSFYFLRKRPKIFKPYYTQVYRLVNEKISQSAALVIYLPTKIEKEIAQKNVKFYPEIEGEWLPSEKEKEIVFKPKEKLKLNRYYLAELTTADGGLIRSDFLVTEDPEIIAIFPKEGSEAPENSEITIVFNRPMVPLTTLGYLEEKEVPVEILPETKGRFKWITTSNLQFIPEERLQRSSHYKVKIKSGLVSMDGLEVKGKEIEFITRKLRYLDLTQGQIIYNQPISIYFNQPVDLEKTKKEITLIDNRTGKEIPFIAEYGKELKRKEISEVSGSKIFRNFLASLSASFGFEFPKVLEKEEIDQTIIQIYNEADRFGRKKFWDFENNYTLKINKAYPIEGDVNLDEERVTNVWVTSPIAQISAQSNRTEYASPEFFDPQGRLWVSFYEEIDLAKSKISAPKLKEIGYGEKCKEEGEEETQCEKVPDKKRIFLIFQGDKISLGENLEINFEKITNLEGIVINREPIKKIITSYPKFKILKTFPQQNSTEASLTELIICSNTPISVPAKEDLRNYFKANLDYEIKSWGKSWKVTYFEEKCKVGEFQTRINYGLMPLSEYSLEIKLEDVFSQREDLILNLTTGEMPSYHLSFYYLQKSYNVTTPEKTKLTYATENMEYLNLEICKLSASDFLYYLENKPNYYDPPSVVGNCQEKIEDKIELPKKYWIKNYFKIDIKNYFENPTGHYILTFSHPNYLASYWERGQNIYRPVYERTYLTITNLAVAEKRISPQQASYGLKEPLSSKQLEELSNLYWVINLSTLEPVSKAKVELYRGKEKYQIIPAGVYYTNEEGIASTDVIYDLKGVIVSKNGDSTLIPSRESRLDWAEMASLAQKIYLYTDKPIYRPGQEVFIKGIYRIGYDGSYEIFREKPINLKVFNSKGDQIFNQDLEINDFGTFDTKLILENNAPLGSYRICAKDYSCIYFDVQEYVPAPFEVKLKTDKDEYISKETLNLEVEANYYFGVPLEGGEVSYTISSQNYYFDRYKDEYFDFDSRWYYWPPHPYGDKFILRGETSLDSQGKAKISQLLDLEKFFKEKEDRKSKIIVVDVTVKNPQGRSISAQKSFILHSGEFYLGLKTDKSFFGKNEKVNLRVKSVDTQGKEISVKNVNLALYKIDWIFAKRQEAGGGYGYQWEKKRELINKFNFNIDAKGNYSQLIEISKEGEYEVEVSAQDKKNNLIFAIYELYVFGEGEVRIKPTTDTKLEIEAEKTDLNIGEEGKIIIKSPYSRAKAFISIERGKIFDYQIKEIKGNLYSFNFLTKEEYLPNVYLSVLLVSNKPEIKFGEVEFQINRERKELDIEVKSDKKFYLPGEEVNLDILTKDYTGKGVPAEVSISVVDLSVLALKGNPKKNPLIFFYGGFPLAVSTASNIKDILVEVEIPTKGGAGMAPEALAKKVRGIFRETALWQAAVRTDEEGKAQVKFSLPDNLTTWQTETLGLTEDTKLGVNYIEFLTKKELMVIPLKPRFIIPGDIFQIGAQIFNQSKDVQKIKIKFESQTLILKDDSEKEITLKPQKTATVFFKVEAPSQSPEKEHKFLISAKSDKLEDTVIQTINVTPNNTYEVTATSNYTTAPVFKEYVFLPENILKDRGELQVKSSATLAVFLSDALNYLLQFPYGCSEQIASKLDAIAIVKRGLNLPNIGEKFKLEKIKYQDKEYTIDEVVEIGLVKLYNNQNFDGGFSFWRGGKSNFHLTLHVLDTLNDLSLAGFKINQDSLAQASDYVYKEITTNHDLYQDKNNVILAAYTLFSLPNFKKDGALRGKIIEIANDDLFLQEKISNNSLAYLAILLNEGFDLRLKNKIFDILDNRIDIDGRGAFLETGKNFNWQYYETPIKNTALYLKAQVARKSENPILEKVLRWILNSREKDGAWGSTQNTISVIDALTDYLEWKKETESNFFLELFINEKSEGKFNFNPQTILDQFKKEIPIENLKFNENNIVSFQKTNFNQLPNAYYYDLSLKYYLPSDQIPPRDEGFSISREFYHLDDKENKNPLSKAKVGKILRGHLEITVPKTRKFVMVEDFIPAGMEIVNLDLATEQKSLLVEEYYKDRNYWREHFDRSLYPDFKETYDDRVFLYLENLSPGVYEFDYYVRALIKGKFSHLPAQVSEMYFPENFGRTAGSYFEIE